jgi:orotate phosphoribosyltransferase
MITALRDRLLALLRERAFRRGEFVLASGEKSDYYIDGKMIEVCPEGACLIGEALYDKIKDLDVQAVGGLAVGAVPLVASTMVICHQRGLAVEGFWVRDEVKDHGTRKKIEGRLPEQARVAIVEDVVTSGASSLKAIAAVEEAGCTVVAVLAIVDRQRGAAETFAKRGYRFEPVFSKDDLFMADKPR